MYTNLFGWPSQNMRLAAITGLVLAYLIPNGTLASRIICQDRNLTTQDWVRTRFDQAEYVFLGEVVLESKLDLANFRFPKTPELHGLDELIEHLEGDEIKEYSKKFDQRIVFEVLKEWKGEQSTKIEVRNLAMPGQYGTYLESGETYLIFAYLQSDDSLMISTVCDATMPVDIAADRIQALDDLVTTEELANIALH